MPRPPRADEAGGLYHALNRGNSRARIFREEADYEAVDRIRAEGLEHYEVQLYCFQLMPLHSHDTDRLENPWDVTRPEIRPFFDLAAVGVPMEIGVPTPFRRL